MQPSPTTTLSVGLSILVCGYIALKSYATRDPLQWRGAPVEMIETADPGDVGRIAFRVMKVRSECDTIPHLMHLEVRDSSGESFSVNQRTGIPSHLNYGDTERVTYFEVPRFAQNGPAEVIMHGYFVCVWPPGMAWRVEQSLPPIPFEITGGENAG